MDENTVEETAEIEQSKLAAFKSRITREGLLLGGVVAGIIIAGGYAIIKSNLEDDSVTIENGDGMLTITENPSD